MADGPRGVAALLLNWRQPDLTLQCLRDLLAGAAADLRVLVLDNGSGDDSSTRLAAAVADAEQELGPGRVELLALPENLGYCGAMNRGLGWAEERGAEFALLLNNDMRLPPGFVEPLQEVLRNDSKVQCVGPTILDPQGRVWSEGGVLAMLPNIVRLRRHGRTPAGRDTGPVAVDFVPGACALVRVAELRALGGLGEDYFMYWEDVDLCARLRRRGGTVLWLPWVQVTHAGSQSSGGGRSPMRKFMMAANAVRYLRRHGTLPLWLAFVWWELLLWPLTLVSGTGLRAGLAKLRGTLAGLFGHRVSVDDVRRYIRGPA